MALCAVSRQCMDLFWNILGKQAGMLVQFWNKIKKMHSCIYHMMKNCLCFLWLAEIGKEMHCCFNSRIPGVRTCANFLQGRYHIWNCSCDWNHYLIMWVIIGCHSPWHIWLFTVQIGMLKGDVLGISSLAYFNSLRMTLIFVTAPGMWYFSLVLFSVRQG